jgi:anti-sigma B factor antagonist
MILDVVIVDSTVRATGELDISTVAQLCRAIHTAATGAPQPPRLIVDLTGLTFCDSTGLRALIGAIREVAVLGGKAVVAVEPDGMLDRLLDLSGLSEFLRVTDSVEAAQRRLTRRS